MGHKTQSAKRPGPGWLSKNELSAVFDVNPRTFEKVYRRYASPESEKTIEGKIYFHARSVVNAWAESKDAGRPKVAPDVDTDPLLAGFDSPALEEYRRHAAREKKVKADLAERSAVPLDEIESTLLKLTPILRNAGEELNRRFGNDAGQILNEAIDQWQESSELALKCDDLNPSADSKVVAVDASASPANNEAVR